MTAVPKAENTWANSAATYPPPMMIMDLGSWGSRITVSEVWNVTSDSPGRSGITGRLPAANTKRSAVIVGPEPIRKVRSATNRLGSVNSVTFSLFSR